MTFRRACPEDIPVLVSLRKDQLQEEGTENPKILLPAAEDYYRRHMADGTFAAWLAEKDGEVVATGGMALAEKPPYGGNPSGKIGLLCGMYTRPGHRRQGIAREILAYVVEEARQWGCGAVHITASDVGALLYRDFGFLPNGNFMWYPLN